MDIINTIAGYGPWAWIVVGVALLALELLVPGGFLIWLGVAGIATGLVMFGWPMDWPFQFLTWGGLSLILIVVWMKFFKNRERPSDKPFLNNRAAAYIGYEGVLSEPITGGSGRLMLGDTVWRVTGPDLPAGQKIRVISADGAVLKVEAANA